MAKILNRKSGWDEEDSAISDGASLFLGTDFHEEYTQERAMQELYGSSDFANDLDYYGEDLGVMEQVEKDATHREDLQESLEQRNANKLTMVERVQQIQSVVKQSCRIIGNKIGLKKSRDAMESLEKAIAKSKTSSDNELYNSFKGREVVDRIQYDPSASYDNLSAKFTKEAVRIHGKGEDTAKENEPEFEM